ncbi:hypothetical protein AQJ27_38210 [Streptomyces olivochromogenes]|uniref:Malate dehydrogenase n=1 Tax=Streptomyces olivochromogenes TaxID=1963 RepID=A0A250VML5_STROL|nr:hypothetical protein AQJ27_38210 [Streptomyces olivochromogenes]GAX55316.1 malate dehydrogenase [Streptomyces olivochromogenes]
MNAESATSAGHREAVGRDSKPVFALYRRGKMTITSTVPLRDSDDLSLAYTPGVAEVCTAISEQPELVHDYTWASHTVAVITDGSAVVADELRPDHIVPSPFEPRVAPRGRRGRRHRRPAREGDPAQ